MTQKILFTAFMLAGWPVLIAVLLFMAVIYGTFGVANAILGAWTR